MRVSALTVAALAVALVFIPAAHERTAPASPSRIPPGTAFVPEPPFGPRQLVFFGYVKSVSWSGTRYLMRVDPALVLTGVSGYRAAVEDGEISPGGSVPNDFYNLNETQRSYTYVVPRSARISVLTNPGAGPRSVVIPVSEFAQILKGKNPAKRPGLWGPASGFWIRVAGDRALGIDQAYRP